MITGEEWRYPQYGNDCESACNCTKEDCDYMNGCKILTGETLVKICYGYVLCFNGIFCDDLRKNLHAMINTHFLFFLS